MLSSGRRATEDICSDIHNISPTRLACGVHSVKKGYRLRYVERAVPPSCRSGSPKELGTEISVPRSRHQILVPGSWYQDLGTKIMVPSSCTVLVWLFCAFDLNQSCLGRWHTLLSRASFPFRFYSLWPPRHYLRGADICRPLGFVVVSFSVAKGRRDLCTLVAYLGNRCSRVCWGIKVWSLG